MDIIKKIAEELQIRPDQVQAVVNLIDEGNRSEERRVGKEC